MPRFSPSKNVTFVYRNFEGLGLGYLASFIRSRGHNARLALYPDPWSDTHIKQRRPGTRSGGVIGRAVEAQLLREIIDSRPDLVAFSVVTDDYQWSLRIARQIKRAIRVPIVFGGVHGTSVPHRVIAREEINYLCVGEGERALVSLLDHLDELETGVDHHIPGIWYKRDGVTIDTGLGEIVEDLDSLPFPAKDLFYDRVAILKRTYTVVTGRGCPYRCSYCHNSLMHPKYREGGRVKWLRRRSVENVMDELRWARDSLAMKHVLFLDDVFVSKAGWVERFGEAYRREIGVPFAVLAEPAMLGESVVVALKDAGCVNMQVGIQTLNEESKKRLRRPESNKKVEEVLGYLKKHKLHHQVDHMLGIPGETIEDQVTAARFYNRLKPDIVSVFWLKYYPRLPIIDLAREKGVLTPGDIASIEEGLNDESCLHGGNCPDSKRYLGFNLLYGYMRWLPRRFVEFIVSENRHRFIPGVPYLWSVVLPRVVSCFSCRSDFRGRDHLRRTVGTAGYIMRLCWRRLRASGAVSTGPPERRKGSEVFMDTLAAARVECVNGDSRPSPPQMLRDEEPRMI